MTSDRESESRGSIRRTLLWLCWLPPVLYVLGLAYVERFEGWGQWAAAPVLLPALVTSVTLGVVGAYLVLAALRRDRRFDWALLAGTALASSVVLYVWLRNVL
jgi:hypothetical protein